jgi:cholesterol transport system auxiliary component
MNSDKARWVMRIPVLLLLPCAALVAAGCGGLTSKAAPDRIYVLQPAPAQAGGTVVPGVLTVARPAVQPGLDSERIALSRAGNELDYFAGSRWGEALPQVLGAFAVQSLAGSFGTVVGAERGAGPANFELLLTVRHFEAEYGADGAAPTVHVALECLLLAVSPRRVLGSCDAAARESAAENRMGAIILAFEKAAQRALQEARAKAVAAAGR